MVWESGRMKSQNQKPPEKPIVKGKEMGMLLGKLLLTESCFGSLSRQRARGACPDPEFPGDPVTPPQSCFLGIAAFLSITFSARWPWVSWVDVLSAVFFLQPLPVTWGGG